VQITKYKSFQIAWITIVVVFLMIIWIYILYSNQSGNKPVSLTLMLVLDSILICIILLFYGLKITLTDEVLKLSFGLGLIRKKINLKNIKSTRVVRNPWYYGLGIKLIPNGLLYNVYGLNAVELTFINERKIIRIGSPECRRLKMEIDKLIF